MKKLLAFAWFVLSAFPALAQDEQPKFPDGAGSINDFANILSDQAKADLHSVVDTFRDAKGPCVVVVTTPSLYGLTVEDYTNQLFKKWKVGHKNNDGIIFLVAPNERKARIEVGYGLEPTIPDLIAKRILAETVRPFLKDNKWDAGILAGTKAIVARLGGEAAELPTPVAPLQTKAAHDPGFSIPWWAWVIAVLVILFIISLVRSGEDGIAGIFLGAMMSGDSGSGGGGSGSGSGSSDSGSSSFGGGDSGGGGSSDSF